jgi:hypothetical protein
MAEAATMTVIAFPLSIRTAHSLARRLRTEGFWTLPISVWNGAADLVEVLAEQPATAMQLRWLRAAHQNFLIER